MAGNFAKGTTVSEDKTLSEIKATLIRFGADRDSFTCAERGNQVGIQFTVGTRTVRITMLLPDREAFGRDRYGRRRPDTAIDKDWLQACREHWRTLAIAVKAKLAMIEKGLSSFEREFLADILLPSGETVGERVVPAIDDALATGEVPPLITGLPSPKVVALGEGRR